MVDIRTVAALRRAIDRAIGSHRCILAKIDSANALLLGFGDCGASPERQSDFSSGCAHELRTHFANWSLESDLGRVDSRSDRPSALENAVLRLVGMNTKEWHFDGSPTRLCLSFEAGEHLYVEAYSIRELKSSSRDSEAWEIVSPEGAHSGVACSGEILISS